MRILDVYLYERFVGRLSQGAEGDLSFSYDPVFLDHALHNPSHPPSQHGLHGISLSLPLTKEVYKGGVVNAFFKGLLPEAGVLDRLAGYLGVSEKNPFAILEIIGGDCAGALSFYTQGQKPPVETNDVEVLDNYRLKEILKIIKQRPLLAGDAEGYRLSLAGAQDKLAVGFRDDKIHLIKGGAPTTHILKPIIDHVHDSAHNEVFCMNLAKRMGLDVPDASLHYVDDTPYYLIKRYDRVFHEDNIVKRIHQEDFCQGLGMAPEIKYEREGGPNIGRCSDLIVNHTKNPAKDKIQFLDMIIFNYLIGNADAHGKNFSLLYKTEKPELAPAYDLLCTAVYKNVTDKMAMKIGGINNPKYLSLRHFYKLVLDTKAAQSVMQKQVMKMARKINEESLQLQKDLQDQGIHADIFEEIRTVIKQRSYQIMD